MAGERVLLIDSSASVQDMTKSLLEEHGFRVLTASNGLAALAHPELKKFALVLIDTAIEGIDGMDTAAQIKTDVETHGVPVLMLIPEEDVAGRGSQSLRGANGYLVKPFSPKELLIKVQEVVEEERLRQLSRQYLEDSADRHMQALAEQKIQQAVEKKIQIIVERAIQSIVSIIDQRARREVDARVTALTAEKEQELVRLTVQEVARSMVEKMAERKVTEAMEAILVDTTEKTVKRAADSIMPSMVRERLKESIENMLPREINSRLDKTMEEKLRELGEALVQVLQTEAKKAVPIIARDKLPELAEKQVNKACEQRIPQLVASEARGAVGNELNARVKPLVELEAKRIRKNLYLVMVVLIVVAVLALAGNLFVMWKISQSGALG